MKPMRSSIAVIAASALPALAAAAAPLAPGNDVQTEMQRAHDVSTLMAADSNTLETVRNAAAGGDAEAMNLLGVLYATGAEVPSDYSVALYWFQKAIDGGSASAMGNLARIDSLCMR